MAIVQCEKKHYYDDKRNAQCPYCRKLSENLSFDGNLNEQMTVYKETDYSDDAQPTEAYGEFVTDYDKTIGFFFNESGNLYTVGWLVCTVGFQKGKSFVLHSGRNFAGRSEEMDIVISDDPKISSNRHFSVVFDPKSFSYYVVCVNGNVYVNDSAVIGEKLIFEGDTISAGDSEFVFIPFCKEGRSWN